MKTSPPRFLKIAAGGAALALALTLSAEVSAQETPEIIPSADGNQIIHTILREGDVNFSLAGRPRSGEKRHQHGDKGRSEKSKGDSKKSANRPDDRKKDSDRPKSKDQGKDGAKKDHPQKKDGEAPKGSDCKKEQPQKKGSDAPQKNDCKKESAPNAVAKSKGNCPSCVKADSGQCEKCKKPSAPLAKKDGAVEKLPPNHPGSRDVRPGHGHPQDLRARQDEMRKRFEEMRKRGGPWVENRNGQRDQRGPNSQGPEVAKIRAELERTQKELENARQSLHMAHKELGDKTLHIKKLEDQVQNFRSQLARAESEMRKFHQMRGEQQELAQALQNERRKNQALQNDVQVIEKKAKEAITKIQAEAKKHVAQSEAKMKAELREHADLLRKKLTPELNGMARKPAPEKSQPKRPDAKSRGTTSRPRKPEPNKPADPEKASIAPIHYKAKSAVNYEERTRVLNDITALLKKSPDVKIKIIGHADDSPYDQVNRDISTNRAAFLGSFLRVSGIDSAKISHEGVGNSAPEKGASDNRRVVIEVVK